tara:strand:- start:117 stop:239 length:123 start_codon:yes stop_codon:yes gene_type:complete
MLVCRAIKGTKKEAQKKPELEVQLLIKLLVVKKRNPAVHA